MKDFTIIASEKNPKITIQVAKGHFATSSAHRSHYVDIFKLMSYSSVARHAAHEMAAPYLTSTIVDVIVSIDGTETLSAYLADELLQPGSSVMNEGSEICIVTPTIRADGRFIFHQSVHEQIANKNAVLVVASMSTGATAKNLIDCLFYYGCNLVGISAIFSAVPEYDNYKINALFTTDDIPDYIFCNPSECEMCKAGQKLDAVFNSEGYTEL